MTDTLKSELLSTKDLAILNAIGVISHEGRATPEAYVGYISRLRVNEQAQALGLPLIVLPPPIGKSNPEMKVAIFFAKDKNLYVDAGFEKRYILRSFIGSITQDFIVKN